MSNFLEISSLNYSGETPVVLLDTDIVRNNFIKMDNGFNSEARIHYAVKANPNIEILKVLNDLGSYFDAASVGEIDRLLSIGVQPLFISFGNTIKKAQDIRYAYGKGISLFAADSEEEIRKIAENAPGSEVYIRMLVYSTEAEWPLSRKFGCSSSYVVPLMDLCKELHLNAVGISFHVGSQARHPHMWNDTLDMIKMTWDHAQAAGHKLTLLNIGGGFPSYYGVEITELEEYCTEILKMIQERFDDIQYLMVEPGRALVADSGYIVAEVVLVSKKNPEDDVRWVYLDIGKFSGLSETMEEAIKYQFIVPDRENEETSKCVLAGPTCDSADVLYEKNLVDLPIGLKSGDRFIIRNSGAYTTTYSSVWFNGFDALKEIVL